MLTWTLEHPWITFFIAIVAPITINDIALAICHTISNCMGRKESKHKHEENSLTDDK